MQNVTGLDIQNFVGHWLKTPLNGYFGLDVGQDLKALLQSPLLDGLADEQIAKLKDDLPVLNLLPAGSVNIYGVASGIDRLDLVIEVAGTAFEIANP